MLKNVIFLLLALFIFDANSKTFGLRKNKKSHKKELNCN